MHSGLMFFGSGASAEVVATATATAVSTTDMTLDISAAGVRAGDIIIVAAAQCTNTTPAYLDMVSTGYSTLLEVNATDAYATSLRVYHKISTGGEATVIVDSGTTNDGKAAIAYIVRKSTGPEGNSGSVINTAVPPSVAINANNKNLAICFFASGANVDMGLTNGSLDGFLSLFANSSTGYRLSMASGYASFVGAFTPDVCGISGADAVLYSAVSATLAV